MMEAGLEENEYGFKIGGRHINNLYYADDCAPIAEHASDSEILVMKIKQHSEKHKLKFKTIENQSNYNKYSLRIDNEDTEGINSKESNNQKYVTDSIWKGSIEKISFLSCSME